MKPILFFLLTTLLFLGACSQESKLGELIQKGDVKAVEQALKSGIDINKTSAFGMTPLGAASRFNQEKIAKLLLDKGANVNQVDSHGWTPVLIATQQGNKAVVSLLIEHGAMLDRRTNDGKTVFDLALAREDPALLTLLYDGLNEKNAPSANSTTADKRN